VILCCDENGAQQVLARTHKETLSTEVFFSLTDVTHLFEVSNKPPEEVTRKQGSGPEVDRTLVFGLHSGEAA
jgi:hypothetical protein